MQSLEPAEPLMTTAEVAAYLRLKERTVYEMASRRQIPCSRATGKLLFHRTLIDAWLVRHTEMPEDAVLPPPPIYAGSSEPLLEWALRQSGSGLAVLAGGSRGGLDALARGEAVMAGIHLLDEVSGGYNLPQVRLHAPLADVVVLHWARRVQGLYVAAGNPLGITGLRDVAERGLRLARRSSGSGSQVLLDALLARDGLDPGALRSPDRTAETETDLSGMIAMGEADCALGIAAAAGGLDFLAFPDPEEFDLVLRRRDYFEAPLQRLFAFARTDAFHQRAAWLGGYDCAGLGEVRYNA